MKQLIKKIALVFFAMVSVTSFAADYKEGEDYVVVSGVASNGKEVTEYFSFYCPACFKQEPVMKQIAASLPTDVKFVKSPVSGLPGRDVNVELEIAKAYVLAKKLGKEKEITAAVFDLMHVKRKPIASVQDIIDLFAENGITANDYTKGINNFSIKMQASKLAKNNDTLKRQGITGVPSLVVNGKYKANTTNIKSVEEYKALIAYLLTLPV